MSSIIDLLYEGNLGCGVTIDFGELVSRTQKIEQALFEWDRTLPWRVAVVNVNQLLIAPAPSRFQTVITTRRHSVHLLIHRPLLLWMLSLDPITAAETPAATLSRIAPSAIASSTHAANECIDIAHSLLLAEDLSKKNMLGAWWYTLYYCGQFTT
jgi:hypothetical protein